MSYLHLYYQFYIYMLHLQKVHCSSSSCFLHADVSSYIQYVHRPVQQGSYSVSSRENMRAEGEIDALKKLMLLLL